MTEHPLESRIGPGDPADPVSAAMADRLRELHPDAEHEQRHEVIVPRTGTEDTDGIPSGVRDSESRIPMVSGTAKLTPPDTDTEPEGTWRD